MKKYIAILFLLTGCYSIKTIEFRTDNNVILLGNYGVIPTPSTIGTLLKEN